MLSHNVQIISFTMPITV